MIILKKVYNYFKILALDITIYLLSILFALMYRYVFSKVYRYFANIVLYKKG